MKMCKRSLSAYFISLLLFVCLFDSFLSNYSYAQDTSSTIQNAKPQSKYPYQNGDYFFFSFIYDKHSLPANSVSDLFKQDGNNFYGIEFAPLFNIRQDFCISLPLQLEFGNINGNMSANCSVIPTIVIGRRFIMVSVGAGPSILGLFKGDKSRGGIGLSTQMKLYLGSIHNMSLMLRYGLDVYGRATYNNIGIGINYRKSY